ncbi:dehydrogenase [Halovivax sp.]|uniref:dehydrogenase n=1 Tax=Halovivax sp. TaxID=1935978 RepID=UPI0025C09CCD|nr:dehydrogenase [Halovivax sp.]
MPTEIAFELPYTEWGWKVGIYIAMIGIAGGAYLTGYAADLLSFRSGSEEDARRHGRVAQFGYLVGLGGLVVGPPVLLSHLATPFRAMMIPLTMTNLGSWMAIGSYLLIAFGLGTALMFLWVTFGRERPHAPDLTAPDEGAAATDGGRDVASDGGADEPARAATEGGAAEGVRDVFDRARDPLDAFADYTRPSEPVRLAIGGFFAVFAAGVVLYSAMAYGSGPTERVAMWDPTFLVPVQILGGLGAGLTAAVAIAAAVERRPGRVTRRYALAAGGLLVATLAAIVVQLVYLPVANADAAPAVENLLTTHATLFVGGAVIAGLLVPIALLVGATYARRREALSPSGVAASYAVAGLLVVGGKITLALAYLQAAEFTTIPLPM